MELMWIPHAYILCRKEAAKALQHRLQRYCKNVLQQGQHKVHQKCCKCAAKGAFPMMVCQGTNHKKNTEKERRIKSCI
jgi:hypothetical protein